MGTDRMSRTNPLTGPLSPDITANRIIHEDQVTEQDLKELARAYKKLLERKAPPNGG